MRPRSLTRAGEAARLAVLALVAAMALGCDNQALRDWLLGPSSSVPPAVTAPISPAPVPTPVPIPAATPPPVVPVPGSGAFPNNTAPVAAVHAKVFFLECDGNPVPGTEYASTAPVGCRVHLDATPRDAGNNHTRAAGGPSWQVEGGQINNPATYTPVLTSRSPGRARAYCYIDGVRSNDVDVLFF